MSALLAPRSDMVPAVQLDRARRAVRGPHFISKDTTLMTHACLISRLVLVAASTAMVAACRHSGGSHHALGDAAVPSAAAFASQGACCSSNKSASAGQHGDHGHAQSPAQTAVAEFKGDPYMLDTDPVSGVKLGPIEKQVVVDHESRELRFANEQNANKFRSDPARYVADVDQALVVQQKPFYALQTCPVSGEKLGGMGEPVDFVFKNRLVRLCCPSCKADFLKEPGKYVAKLDAAVVAAQGKSYLPRSCIVSGEEFGGEMGEPVDYVVGNRMVRLCCKGCVKKLRADPLMYLARLDQLKKAGEKPHGAGHEHGDHK